MRLLIHIAFGIAFGLFGGHLWGFDYWVDAPQLLAAFALGEGGAGAMAHFKLA